MLLGRELRHRLSESLSCWEGMNDQESNREDQKDEREVMHLELIFYEQGGEMNP